MLFLKIAFNDESKELVNTLEKLIPEKFPTVSLETFHEEVYKEQRKARMLKSTWGTKHTPFAILINEENNPIKAFYQEEDNCNLTKILEVLTSLIVY